MADDLPAIAMLGAGSMGGAILAGVLAAGAPAVRAVTRTTAGAGRVAAHPALEVRSVEDDADALSWAVAGAGLVVVAVKPAGVAATLHAVRGALEPDAVVVSVAAGIPLAAMRDALGDARAAVVRAMPNTPAGVGLGVTGLAGDGAPEGARALARRAFETVGTVIEVPESDIDALSAVSGSGPAYVFDWVERFEAAARRLGFDAATARAMVVDTVRGAAALLADGTEAAELRRRVTSPGGTTERALAVFAGAGLDGVFDEALAAAMARAAELARG